MKDCIKINTKKDNVIIKINEESSQEEIIEELKDKMRELKKLYKEDKTPILVTGKEIFDKEKNEIKNIIKEEIDVEVKFENVKSLGLHRIRRTFNEEIATSETKFHRGSIRSGQKIEFEGSIVIIGDVNAGAEVLAGENIVVLGNLRGMAHAGAKGNKKAIITALAIESVQIRIANVIKEIEKDEMENEIKSYAYINEEDKIIIE